MVLGYVGCLGSSNHDSWFHHVRKPMSRSSFICFYLEKASPWTPVGRLLRRPLTWNFLPSAEGTTGFSVRMMETSVLLRAFVCCLHQICVLIRSRLSSGGSSSDLRASSCI